MDVANKQLQDRGIDVQLKVKGPADDTWLFMRIMQGKKPIGYLEVMVRSRENGLKIQSINLESQYQRQGVGTNIYIAVNEGLGAFGDGVIKSAGLFDAVKGPKNLEGVRQAEELWNSLIRKGLAKFKNGVYEMLPVAKDLGGIDFNPDRMDLKRTGERAALDWGMSQTELENVQISGLTPVIIQITPIQDLQEMLSAVK
jgi:hypothetical protein